MAEARILSIACAVLALSALAGCTGSGTASGSAQATAVSTAVASASATVAYDDSVVPDVAGDLDEDSAGTEAVRLADAIEALVPAASIVYSDDHDQYVAASDEGAAYYGVIRTITLEGGTDATAQSAAIIATLEASGWTRTQTTEQDGLALTALVSSLDAAAWFVLIGGDDSGDEPVLSLQLASPDLP
ncbi:MAG: hypothetical protein QM635_01250 [Microbacteriaceae bacterium]